MCSSELLFDNSSPKRELSFKMLRMNLYDIGAFLANVYVYFLDNAIMSTSLS